jgi:hypothetical protein
MHHQKNKLWEIVRAPHNHPANPGYATSVEGLYLKFHSFYVVYRGGGLALALVLINTNSRVAMSGENKIKQKCWNKKMGKAHLRRMNTLDFSF